MPTDRNDNHTELRANSMLSELKAHINGLIDRIEKGQP